MSLCWICEKLILIDKNYFFKLVRRLPELEFGREWVRVARVPEGPGGSFGAVLATEVGAGAGVDEAALDGPESSSSVVAAAVAVAVNGQAAPGFVFQPDNPVDD